MGRVKKTLRVLQTSEYWPAALLGVAAAIEHEQIPFRYDHRTVIDVGAARGQFAIVARRRFPQARIVSLEPLAAAQRTLRRIAKRYALEILPLAAGVSNEDAVLRVSAADDSSSLLPIGDAQRGTFPGTQEVAREPVHVVRLDAVVSDFDRPALLKIDVQGAELDVMRGASGILPSIDEVLVEASFIELYVGQALADIVLDLLVDQGFRLRGVYSVAYTSDGQCVQCDLHLSR